MLGAESAFAFVQFVFTTATEGLLARQSTSLIQDRVRTELLDHLHSAEARLLAIAADHASYVFELATAIRDHVFGPDTDAAGLRDLAQQGKRWEHAAGELVVKMTEAVERRPELGLLLQLIDLADAAVDSLEEATFLLGLLDGEIDHTVLQPLAAILAECAQEWVKAVGHAQHVKRHGLRDDADDFLKAVDRLAILEHDADEAERVVTATVLKTAGFRDLHVLSEVWHGLGEASFSLKRASMLLRSHVVAHVLTA